MLARWLIVVSFSLLSLGAAGCGERSRDQVGAADRATAESGSYVTTRDALVRSGPGEHYRIVAEVKTGTLVNVTGREGEWLRVVSKRGNPPGYIEARSARRAASPATGTAVEGTFTVQADTYVRRGPGLHHEVITRVSRGTEVHVVGGEGGWLRVESKHGRPPGYIDRQYVQKTDKQAAH
jgi:uncharacterized protein YgiM (DUF1202 family)